MDAQMVLFAMPVFLFAFRSVIWVRSYFGVIGAFKRALLSVCLYIPPFWTRCVQEGFFMLLRAQNIKKEYGIQTILDIEKIEIQDGDRIGLIGRNGAGKSTLLGVLSGRIPCDEGVIRRECEIGEILQEMGEPSDAGGAAARAADCEGRFISQLGLKDSAVKSGGERMRLAIAEAFSGRAPLLFADEPTTNLDVDGVKKLERMLAGYRGAVVLISHDRMLLDSVCTCIWELEEGKLRVFDGSYSAWAEQKNREREFKEFEYQQYQKEKHRLEQAAVRLREKSRAMAKPPRRMGSSEWMLYKGIASVQQGHVQSNKSAIDTRLSQLEKKEKPAELPHVSMKLPEGGRIRAKAAASIRHLTVEYEGRLVLADASLTVEAGKRTILTGANGAGKSTLIRALIEGAPGTFITSEAKIGYFSQDLDTLDLSKTVLENVMADAAFPQHICRAVLANLYMSRADMEKKAAVLSGGERVKTALAKVLVSGCSFMILDEPTNHMDVYTMEGLEALLSDYDGTLLAVSHDRRFTEKIGDVVYRVEGGEVE